MKQTRCSNFLETNHKIFTEAPVVQQFAGLPHLGMSAVAGGVLVPVQSGGLASRGAVGVPEPGQETRGPVCLCGRRRGAPWGLELGGRWRGRGQAGTVTQGRAVYRAQADCQGCNHVSERRALRIRITERVCCLMDVTF